jgi:hypothetical protein
MLTFSVKTWPQTPCIVADKATMPQGGAGKRMEKMKTRWLKSVVEHSKEAAPALPYHRQVRRAGVARTLTVARALKSA